MADEASAPPTGLSGSDPTPLTDTQLIQNWRRSNYIQYPYHGRTLDVNINDFLHYSSTGSEDYANAWLSEDQVTLPLALIADNKGRPDILILESAAASCLASIGLGLVTPDDFAAAHLGMFAGMKDESINWIIAPCNDGMTRQAEIALAAKKKAEMPVKSTVTSKDTGPVGDHAEEDDEMDEEQVESDALDKNTNTQTKEGAVSNTMKEPKSDYGKGSYQGMHWGVMIIDKARNEARWLDGAINLTRKNGKVCIRAPMLRAGWVAGKVLCGYDRVMQLPRGQFTATTLKHTPHEYRDNSFRGDTRCACGPWVIAIIQYILDNAGFLTAEHGLKGTFASNRRRGHVIGMAFDSLRTRTAAQEMVKAEYEREMPSDALPCRLTLRILKIICNSDNLRKNLDSFLGNGRTPPGGAGGNSGKTNGGNDSDDDDETGNHRDTDVLKSTLMDIVRSDPGAYSHLNTNDEKRELARINQIELEKNLEKAKAEKEKAERERAMKENPFGTGPHSKNPVLVYPDGFSKDNLPNFASLSNSDVSQEWYPIYEDDLFDLSRISPGRTYLTCISVLHRTYKGSFSNEPWESLRKYVHDDFAFDKADLAKKWTTKDVADRLNHVYNNLDIPCFATLSEEFINHWVEGLPPKVRKILVKDDKSIEHGRARGMLYRMYVKDLDNMTADDITAWRQADPSIPPEYKQDNESVKIFMKIFYEGPDAKYLPRLVNSPLHWPLREHRAKYGEKRKRAADEEENDEDETDDGQDPKTTGPNPAKRSKITEDPKATNTSTPDKGPQPAQDPKTVDWLNMTDVNLAQYITDEVRADSRIGDNPNNYTYRAILFLKHGGTFKDASQTPHTDLWVRDTNVFKHGLDLKDATIDLKLRRDPEIQLEVVPGPEGILKRLAAVYEPATQVTVPEPEPVTAPVKNKANKSVKAKPTGRAKSKTPGGKLTLEELKTHIIPFGKMTQAQIDTWVDKGPVGAALTRDQPFWLKKAILQHIFGGFEILTDNDMKPWKGQDPEFRNKGPFSTKEMKNALKRRVAHVPKSDFRGMLHLYPEEWVKKNM
jgi:hypothetical protein